MRKTTPEHEVCFGIPFQTWLVILAVIAIGLIHTMSVRPAPAMPHRTAVWALEGKLALVDKPPGRKAKGPAELVTLPKFYLLERTLP